MRANYKIMDHTTWVTHHLCWSRTLWSRSPPWWCCLRPSCRGCPSPGPPCSASPPAPSPCPQLPYSHRASPGCRQHHLDPERVLMSNLSRQCTAIVNIQTIQQQVPFKVRECKQSNLDTVHSLQNLWPLEIPAAPLHGQKLLSLFRQSLSNFCRFVLICFIVLLLSWYWSKIMFR